MAMGLAETQDQESNPTTGFQYKQGERVNQTQTLYVCTYTPRKLSSPRKQSTQPQKETLKKGDEGKRAPRLYYSKNRSYTDGVKAAGKGS